MHFHSHEIDHDYHGTDFDRNLKIHGSPHKSPKHEALPESPEEAQKSTEKSRHSEPLHQLVKQERHYSLKDQSHVGDMHRRIESQHLTATTPEQQQTKKQKK